MSSAALKPPELSTVDRLIAIWSRTLQCTDVTADSDFFDLGGDSLLAVNLFLEIEREMGRHLPITAIYDAPTIAELATLIEQEETKGFSPLVLLKEGGRGAPLFIVHGVGGTVIDLAQLGKAIESDGPVYALQARGIDGQDAPLESIVEMAEYYVEAVREIAPRGPYRLAGYSFGGMVAIEMARRLPPETVDTVILLDSFAHPQTWPAACRRQVRVAKLVRQFRDKAGPALFTALARKARKLLFRGKTTAGSAAQQRAASVRDWLGSISPDLPKALRDARIAGSVALLAYWPSHYAGKVTFLRAGTTGDVFPANPAKIWRPMVAQLEVKTIPGSHRSIVAEDAATTAAAISALIGAKPVEGRQPFNAILKAGSLRVAVQ